MLKKMKKLPIVIKPAGGFKDPGSIVFFLWILDSGTSSCSFAALLFEVNLFAFDNKALAVSSMFFGDSGLGPLSRIADKAVSAAALIF